MDDLAVGNAQTADARVSTSESTTAQAGAGGSGTSLLSSNKPEATDTEQSVEQQIAATAAPERYELKVPEGMYLPEQIAAAEKQFREMGLDNDAAQKLIDMSVSGQQQARDQHAAQVKKWADDVRADKELGGAQLESTVMHAKAGLQRFDADGEVFGMLEQTGYANHPAVIRMLARIGRELGEDGLVTGKGNASPASLEDRLFKNMKV